MQLKTSSSFQRPLTKKLQRGNSISHLTLENVFLRREPEIFSFVFAYPTCSDKIILFPSQVHSVENFYLSIV